MPRNRESSKTEGACFGASRTECPTTSRPLLHHLDAASHQGEDRGAVLSRDSMRAAVGTVVHIAGEHLAGLIGIRTFYYEDQFVADVLMTRQLRAGIEARQRNASLGLLVVPDRFLAYPGHRIDPGDFAEVDVLRRRSAGQVACGLDAAGDDGQDGRAILAADAVDASVRTIADISGRGSAVFVGD